MFELPTGDVYQLHIRLAYIEPPIWRRIVVPGQISLFRLHRMLQVVMGWENYHPLSPTLFEEERADPYSSKG
ncbi:MAG: IS1096 element passenger TnpR family protein [Ktedonobacteraceae bacterium]